MFPDKISPVRIIHNPALPATQSLREKRYPALDGLRGLAALMVVAHHSPFSYGLTSQFDKAWLRATSLLWVGVDLFFVLSGFLITNILLDTKTSSTYFRTFYGRRVVRIFPLYYAFLSVLYFLLPHLGIEITNDLLHVQVWQWTYTSNIYVGLYGWPNSYLNHLWTLAIEEQFYMLWPFVVLIMGERMLKEGIVGLLVFLPFIRAVCLTFGLSTLFIYTFTFCHMDGLLWGALICLLVRQGFLDTLIVPRVKRTIQWLDWIMAALVFAFVALYCFGLRNDQFQFNILTWTWYGQCAGMSLVSLPLAYAVFRVISSDTNRLKRAMSVPVLRHVGKYSYALYLLHLPICYWVGSHIPIPGFLTDLPNAWSFLRSMYIIIMQFGLSIVAAMISWHIWEKHWLKLKKYFPYSAQPKRDVRIVAGGL